MSQLSLVDQKRIELYLANKLTRVSSEPNSPEPLSFPQAHVFQRAEHNTDKLPFYNECIRWERRSDMGPLSCFH
jgi:hypothetical protein